MSRHNYIVGGIPNLVTTRRPIYKVPTAQIKVNPYHWKPGLINLVPGWPFGEATLEIEPTIQPVQTRKIRGSDGKVELVPIGTTNIEPITPAPTEGIQELPIAEPTIADKAIADYNEWYDKEIG